MSDALGSLQLEPIHGPCVKTNDHDRAPEAHVITIRGGGSTKVPLLPVTHCCLGCMSGLYFRSGRMEKIMPLGRQKKSIYICIIITPKYIKNILNLLKCITMEGKFGIKVRIGK